MARVENGCLNVDDARLLVEKFGADRAWMMIRAIAQERRWQELEIRALRQKKMPVPFRLQILPGDIREEQVVDSDVVGILIKAAKCLADAGEV